MALGSTFPCPVKTLIILLTAFVGNCGAAIKNFSTKQLSCQSSNSVPPACEPI